MGIITYHNFLENQSLIEAEKLEFLYIAISLTKFKSIVCHGDNFFLSIFVPTIWGTILSMATAKGKGVKQRPRN